MADLGTVLAQLEANGQADPDVDESKEADLAALVEEFRSSDDKGGVAALRQLVRILVAETEETEED